ncbi:hypothetical protein IEQ34_010337 [Dendrobium chrysotoxum]|uniref:Uncharacterized protein n=1 Tax=Dendrobium chrysotoxum TaxID=161865 RepID=A0AAV7H1L3_DENCH|nr:hypothetical protein IEQ34_010337 [Dendrobium chrysotoxum]
MLSYLSIGAVIAKTVCGTPNTGHSVLNRPGILQSFYPCYDPIHARTGKLDFQDSRAKKRTHNGFIVKINLNCKVIVYHFQSIFLRSLLMVLILYYFKLTAINFSLISQANSGPNTNGCQRVLGEGLLVVRKIENVATGPNNRPKLACVVSECGEM